MLTKLKIIFILSSTVSLKVLAGYKIDTLDSRKCEWNFAKTGKEYYRAIVPGSNIADLLRNGLIEDPYKEDNFKKLRWVEEETWVYKTDFEGGKSENYALIFEGLDTYADVFLNGDLILQSKNMQRRHFVNLKKNVKSGKNELKIIFKPLRPAGKKLASALPYSLPAENETDSVKISPFIRKAGFQFGWDTNPALLSCGITKPILLVKYDKAYLTDVAMLIDNQSSWLMAYVRGVQDAGQILVKAYYRGNLIEEFPYQIKSEKFYIKQKTTSEADSFSVWLNGSDGKSTRIGACFLYLLNRDIKLIREKDEKGELFTFTENGVPFYTYGANYVPYNLYTLPDERNYQSGLNSNIMIRKITSSASLLGMNMIRVWGGGWSETDFFYESCLENNLMVWQDFYFANTLYPADTAFLNEVKLEIEDIIVRLNKFPNVALYCGNNEIDMARKYWGWSKKFGYSAKDSLLMANNYRNIFEEIIPSIVQQYSIKNNYIPSTPLSNWAGKDVMNTGDNHLWGVWHGEKDINWFSSAIPRFASEFGMPSLPDKELISLYMTAESDSALYRKFLNQRFFSYKGPKLLYKYIQTHYGKVNPEQLSEQSREVQKVALNLATRAQLKSNGHCMGSLIWQLNESWPGVTWSILQWDGKMKFSLK